MASIAKSPEEWAKEIFLHAESFSLASENLAKLAEARAKQNENNRARASLTEGAPLAVLDSFATELYLKCLHWIDHSKGPNRLHTYCDLFNALLPATRESIRTWYIQIINDQYAASLKQHSAEVPGFDHSLENCLKLSNDTFTQIRYGYELGNIEIFYWPALRIAIRNVIASSHPGWSWTKK